MKDPMLTQEAFEEWLNSFSDAHILRGQVILKSAVEALEYLENSERGMIMTKQQKIREAVHLWADDGCLFPDRSCNALGADYCSSSDEAYKCLMERLGKIGVVLKVESRKSAFGYRVFLRDIEDAGWSATESLI